VLDEVAFWRSDESANPDREVLTALRPATATVPGSMIVGISTPYARKGVLWQSFKDHYGKDGDPVLVWQADTRSMNPTIGEHVIAAAYAADEASAAAEYGALFRRDIESFIAREAVEAAVVPGRHELPAISSARYVGFVDPSGGSQDSMTLAIAHHEARDEKAKDDPGMVVLDAIRERKPPFSPEDVVHEFVKLLKAYHVTEVNGDRYGGEWCREPFRKSGITYRLAERPKSELYRELLPLVNSGRVELLDHPRLITQLLGLERRTARGGKDSINHAPNAHDDLVNAVAGVLVAVAENLTEEPELVAPITILKGPDSPGYFPESFWPRRF
jgi:hypothetical protein